MTNAAEGKAIPVISDFDALIQPVTRAEFGDSFVGKTPLHVRTTDRDRAKYLLTFAHINDIITSGLLWPDRFTLKRDGTNIPEGFYTNNSTDNPINPAKLAKVIRQGASIVLKELSNVVPEVGDLEQIIHRELIVDGWANAYVSFAKGGALSVHYDDHDVLVIQVDGRKRWRLYGQTEVSPVRPMRISDPGPEAVVAEHLLEPGDLLFVPRGFWHRAELESPSAIHLTFALVGFTGVDLIRKLIDQSELEELFRNYAPRTAGAAAMLAWERDIKTRLRHLVEQISASAALAGEDGRNLTRPVSRLGLSPNLNDATVLRTALRRRLDESLWRQNTGGALCSLTPAGRLAMQVIDERTVSRFGALRAPLEAQGLDQDAIADAVVELLGHGLVIADDRPPEAA